MQEFVSSIPPRQPDQSEEARIKKLKEDIQEQRQFVKKTCQIILFGYNAKYTNTTIEDLTQEILLKACRNASKYRGEAKLTTWLDRITKTTIIDFLRRQKNEPSASGISVDTDIEGYKPFELPDKRLGPEKLLLRQEEQEIFKEGMKKLSPRQKQVVEIILANGGEKTQEKLAEELGIPYESLKDILFKAKKKLTRYAQSRYQSRRA